MEIANLILNGVVSLIVGFLAVWVFRLQGERLAVKDEQIRLLERERDEARKTAEERMTLAQEIRDKAERDLGDVLEDTGVGRGTLATGEVELGEESKELIRSVLERLGDAERLVQPEVEDAEAHFLRGNAYSGVGDYDAAIAEYS